MNSTISTPSNESIVLEIAAPEVLTMDDLNLASGGDDSMVDGIAIGAAVGLAVGGAILIAASGGVAAPWVIVGLSQAGWSMLGATTASGALLGGMWDYIS